MAAQWSTQYSPEFQDPVALRVEEDMAANACAIHGVCSRNAVTGQVKLQRANLFPDFTVVDLWTRPCLFGSPQQLSTDKYVFRPDPFLYRTWIYHDTYRSPNEMARHHGENGILEYVLGSRVIDANRLHAGRYCPILYYGPLCLAACLTCDIAFVTVSILVSVLSLATFILLNHPAYYYWCRPITLPFRLFLFGYIFVSNLLKEATIIVVFGVIISALVILLDLFMGDANMLTSFGLHCSYEVVKELPNRVFVCRRHGAAFGQDWTSRQDVHDDVSGTAEWGHDMHLIAEVRGIIVELTPMSIEDWKTAWEMVRFSGKPIPFIGLDVFNEYCPTFRDTMRNPHELLADYMAKQEAAGNKEPVKLKGHASKNLIE